MSDLAPNRPARLQVAALPVRIGPAGDPEILLITTRESRRWIVPKGWPMKGRKDHQAAAREAREEAGVIGKADRKPVGSYVYRKRLIDRDQTCRVKVFYLVVKRELKGWAESHERQRRWCSPSEAADLLSERGLSELVLGLFRSTVRSDDSQRVAAATQ
jgi:8-oxo-dGTP pyrophosphatase MutT (NUDIX family)